MGFISERFCKIEVLCLFFNQNPILSCTDHCYECNIISVYSIYSLYCTYLLVYPRLLPHLSITLEIYCTSSTTDPGNMYVEHLLKFHCLSVVLMDENPTRSCASPFWVIHLVLGIVVGLDFFYRS